MTERIKRDFKDSRKNLKKEAEAESWDSRDPRAKNPRDPKDSRESFQARKRPLERAQERIRTRPISTARAAAQERQKGPLAPIKTERLQKLLAEYGLGSRREIEGWIEAGRLSVNKKQAQLGDKASIKDFIELDNQPLKLFARVSETPRVILYHKPEGEVCSRYSTEEAPSVFLNLPKLKTSRWVMVGRLDIGTAGLLLFTTSGELANRLMHPSSNIEREYACRIFGELTPEQIKAMKEGVEHEGEKLKFETIRLQGGEGRNHWYHVIIKTGKNREVRRVFETQEVVVSRLIRVRFGDLGLPPRLKKGDYLELDAEQDLKFLGKPEKDLVEKESEKKSERKSQRAPARKIEVKPEKNSKKKFGLNVKFGRAKESE